MFASLNRGPRDYQPRMQKTKRKHDRQREAIATDSYEKTATVTDGERTPADRT